MRAIISWFWHGFPGKVTAGGNPVVRLPVSGRTEALLDGCLLDEALLG